jgi:hypothetical protein
MQKGTAIDYHPLLDVAMNGAWWNTFQGVSGVQLPTSLPTNT